MNWYIGQEVGVLRETGIFEIIELHNDYVVLEDENGFNYRYKLDLITPRHAIFVDKISLKDQELSDRSKRLNAVQAKETTLPSIDLHAEELGLPSNYAAHEVFTAQIAAFKRFCNLQSRQRIAKFLVIHGAGEGRLKEEIRQLVMSRPGISMHDAQWSNGAVGCSRIELILSSFTPF